MFSRKNLLLMIGSVVALALVAPAFGGGYWLEFANPSASTDPAAKGALAIVRSMGCGEPSKSTVSATAEGLVKGQRKSLPLETVALKSPGVYAIKGDLPAEGAWAVSVTGHYMGHYRGVIAGLSSKGFERRTVKATTDKPSAAELDALLHDIANPKQASR